MESHWIFQMKERERETENPNAEIERERQTAEPTVTHSLVVTN